MGIYKNGASPAQQQYIDSLVTSQSQVLGINQNFLTAITALKDNSVASQIAAAVALVQMKVSPVIAMHIPFGGDNHSDANLATEVQQTVGADGQSGVGALVALFNALTAAGLQDQVSFISLNVFGRTMGPSTASGRNHNGNHHMSLAIGKPFQSAVIGGVVSGVQGDYGCTGIDSSSGAADPNGDITPVNTLGSFALSVLTAMGGDPTWVSQQVSAGKVVPAMIAP